ncbi:MAG TPA: ATP-binding protein, partial [Syntrophorhabdaceae bacterium]|nr:ATP-binding protein [Syntrophorhabdaceae bacterium]
ELAGNTMTEAWPEIQPRIDEIFRKVLRNGETYMEIDQPYTIFRDPNRPPERAYFTWSVSRILMPDGSWGLLNTAFETTARKQIEEELRQAKDEMELRVKERTLELQAAYEKLAHEVKEREQAEDQLRQSQKMEAIGTLAGGIAHDFNNILAGILGFTEMAIEDAEGLSQIEKSLSNVLKAAKRGRDLVKQILAFSRKTDYERNPFAVTPIIKETIKLLRASIPATVDIRLSTTAQSDVVNTSPTEIQQIIMNLSTNAFMAMEEKGGILEISLSDAFQGGDTTSGEYLQIIVKDTGMGMTPEVIQKAFDPFFTTREPGKGTGMGLAVVYGIVRNLNGSITVLSTPGEGSTFRIFLPKAKVPASTEQDRSIDIQTGNETVLFVEDEEMLNDWGQTVLEKLGYIVHAFRDPQEALQAFIKDPGIFDVLITDQAMPGMTGSQLILEILALRKDLPVILCSGYAEPIPPERAAEIGISEVLLKPLTKYELAAAVRRVLDNGKSDG